MNAPTLRVACSVCESPHSRYERTVNGFALVRCRGCGFVFMNPRYSAAEIAQLYTDRDAEDLVGVYGRITSAESVQADYKAKLDLIESFVPERGRLLDFGCGSGAFFELAQKRGWDAHGNELGTWAHEAAAARGLSNLHVGNLRDIGFAERSFDVVHAAQVFEHLLSPRSELQQLLRLLRPGGLLYVDVPNYQTLPILLGRDDFMLNEPPQHVNYFTPSTLRHVIASSGFSGIRTFTGGGLKWENLLGRSLRSEITEAYGIGTTSDAPPRMPQRSSGRVGPALKDALIGLLVKPVLYERLKIGMKLVAVARRP